MTASFDTPQSADTHSALARLRDADENVRRVALLELADLGDPDFIERFVAALGHDRSPAVRQEAARILAEWEQDDVVESLCAALLDTDETVRRTAAQSLSELKNPESAHVLLAWAERSDPFLRATVLRGLRELRCPDAFALAHRALGDVTAAVRFEAISVLGWLKDARALVALAHLCAFDPEPDLRRAAAGALGFAAADDNAVVSALLTALADAAWRVREQAASTLGKLAVPTAATPLMTALDDDYWQVRVNAVRALGRLREVRAATAMTALLRHTVSNLRKEAALALGELGLPETLPALHDALRDGDPEVRKSARIAIAHVTQVTQVTDIAQVERIDQSDRIHGTDEAIR